MKQTKTARELLAHIEKNFFSGVGLDKASLLKGKERRTYRLSQVERLLTEQNGGVPMAMWLSDVFWTADNGRIPIKESHPLLLQSGLQSLTTEEQNRLVLIKEVAGLCHDLSLYFMFDLKEAFGVRNDFWISNKQLVNWLSKTEYEHIAVYTAYIMRKFAIDVYFNGNYQPAQDALAELFSVEFNELVRDPNSTEMPSRAYVRTILDTLLQIERHWQRGQKLGLEPEVVLLHDEICGVVPRQFNKRVLQAAQALYDYMDCEVYENKSPDVLKCFAEKVREVRDLYLAKGWVEDYSLEFNYLLAHAERCADGWWREEDRDL